MQDIIAKQAKHRIPFFFCFPLILNKKNNNNTRGKSAMYNRWTIKDSVSHYKTTRWRVLAQVTSSCVYSLPGKGFMWML